MKLSNQVLAIVLHVAVIGLSLQSFANREDFNKPSKQLAEAIATSATSMGYDLSSKDGRKQFGDYMKTQRDTLATSLGIDMATEEGRQKYKEAVKTHIDEVATAQKFDLTTKDGREALEKYLISSGEFAYVRPEPKEKHGARDEAKAKDLIQEQSDDKKFASDDKKDGRNKDQATNSQQGERRGPPPQREQRQGANQVNGNTQEQRPEQRQ